MNLDVTNMKEEFVQKELSNGVRVIIYPKNETLTAAFGIFVRTGGWNEDPNTESGIAHVIEHMMFKSTKKLSTKDLNQAFDDLGAENNAFTDWDRTVYHAVVPHQNLSGLITLMSGMVQDPLFDQKELDTEKGAILAEVRRYNDDHQDKTIDFAQSRLFSGSLRFRDPLIGIESQIEKMTSENLFSFKNRQYLPRNIALCVVGKCDIYATMKLIEDLWSNIVFDDRETNAFELPNSGVCNEAYEQLHRDTEQVHLCEMIHANGIEKIRNCREVLCLLNKIYGGGMTSRLFTEVREKRGMAYASYSWSWKFGRSLRLFNTYVGTSKKNKDEVIKLIPMIQDDLAEKEVDELELTRAKTSVVGAIMKSHDDIHHYMIHAGTALLRTGTPLNVFDRINKVQTVLPYEVKDMAIQVFHNCNSVRVAGEKNLPTEK